MPEILDVFLHERRIGAITNLANDRNAFEFDPVYAADPLRDTLSLSFLDVDRNIVQPTATVQRKINPFFSNLLPEGHLRSYLAQKAQVNVDRDFPLLWILGPDLPGAVTIRHRHDRAEPPRDGDFSKAEMAEGDASVLRFSLAGVQLKFSAIRESSGGLTIPVQGSGGDWILKLPSPIYDKVPENEFSMMTLAKEVGIEIPEVHLVNPTEVRNLPSEIRSDLGKALLVKRFDRQSGRRIHTEDFNQVFGQFPGDKYKNVSYGNMLANIWKTMGEEQSEDFVRRLVFSIGIGNADMHLKNWSLIYLDGRTPTLAPAYDYVSTIAYIENDKLGLTLAKTRDWGDVDEDRLTALARRSGVPRGSVLKPARDMVVRLLDAWSKNAADLELTRESRSKISRHMQSIPIFGGSPVKGLRAKLTDEPKEIG